MEFQTAVKWQILVTNLVRITSNQQQETRFQILSLHLTSKKNCMNIFSKKLLVFLVAPVLFLSFKSLPDRANFSGEWKLNEGKSDLGQFAAFAPRTIKVDQKNDSIMISKTAPSFNGDEVTATETLSFDGKEVESTLFGTSKRKASAKWSDDGQTLTITFNIALDFNGQTTEIKGTETWTLTDGGKTLVSQNNSSSSFGDIQAKGVYEK
jgi:hypothetical protein